MIRSLTFGEILWDIIEGKPYIGGAPFNLAAHLSRMGGDVAMVSALGSDDLGRRAYKKVGDFGISTRFVSEVADAPTGTVDVFLDSDGQPGYTIHEKTAWDRLTLSPADLDEVISDRWGVICFGTLSQRSAGNRSLLAELLICARSDHFFYDVNLRQKFYTADWIADSFKRSTIVKLNDDEVRIISRLLYENDVLSREGEERFVRKIAVEYELDTVLVTRGKDGALVYNGGVFGETSCSDVEVTDAVGAGDSFSAGFLHAYLGGNTALESARFASRVADFVVSRRGAIPEYSRELFGEIERLET